MMSMNFRYRHLSARALIANEEKTSNFISVNALLAY